MNVNDIKTDTTSVLGQKVVWTSLGLLVLLFAYTGAECFGCTIRKRVMSKGKYICIASPFYGTWKKKENTFTETLIIFWSGKGNWKYAALYFYQCTWKTLWGNSQSMLIMPVMFRVPYSKHVTLHNVLRQQMTSFCEISIRISNWRPTGPSYFFTLVIKKDKLYSC
jgi:hypothetical protein